MRVYALASPLAPEGCVGAPVSAAKTWVTESVHVYAFDAYSGEFSTRMETAAADEREARRHIRERLARCGLQRDLRLISVRWNVYKRTKTLPVAS